MEFRALWLVVVAVVLGGCVAQGRDGAAGVSTGNGAAPKQCVDRDQDGFGDHCAPGIDCDDHDPAIHQGCLRCATPNEGCDCARGTRPTQCFLDKSKSEDGTVMCNEGTRYCRDGRWSGCESVYSYPLPEHTAKTALINTDGGPVQCNDCNVVCFQITDNLDPVDGGLPATTSMNVSSADGGGLTLALVSDAGPADAGPLSIVSSGDFASCPGTAPDYNCDGIPDKFQPHRPKRPKNWTNPALFYPLAPGQTGVGVINLRFSMNYADFYFLTDASGSASSIVSQLQQDLTTGNFLNPSYTCADTDYDGTPNNELRDQGIIGGIHCDVREANFGLGFFREIPFPSYAPDDQIAFGSYQDITTDPSLVQAAVNRLSNFDNFDWPEASMVGLDSLLTGNGMYFGTTKRSILPRTDCPAGLWGYPCFRSRVVPVVLLFTDGEFHNGPDTNTYPYDPSHLSIVSSTDGQTHPIANTNESFDTAANLGDLTNAYKTFTGDTTSMAADLSGTMVGSSCLSNDTGNDALFRFDLTQRKAVTIESTGSQFDTVLGLFTGVPGSPTDLLASANTNEAGASALDMGEVHGSYVRVAGNTGTMAADYQFSDLGTCGPATKSPDAVFKFSLSGTTEVAIDSSGSSFNTVMGLYSASPALPPSYTPVTQNNDAYGSSYAAGELYNHVLAFSGDTSNPGLHSDYTNAQLGCGTDGAANDVVYTFTLSTPTHVRLSTEGSGFDTVLGLYNNGSNPIGTASVSNNETQTTAYNAGTANDRIFNLSGSTTGMVANYSGSQVGCNANDASPDAVFKFHLNTPKNVQIDTLGTSWDTALSLFNTANFDATSYPTATNNNEVYASATNLGTINGSDIRYSGATTASMAGDYGTSMVSCTSATSAPDAIYKFNLSSPTTVRVDLEGSGFDTVLSLHTGGLPASDSTTTLATNTNDTQATAKVVGTLNNTSQVFNGNDSALPHDYNIGCNTDAFARDSVFQFTLSSATQVQLDTTGSTWDTALGLYPSTVVALPSPINLMNANKTFTSAYDVGVLNGKFFNLSGDTTGTNDDTDDANCGSNKSSEDAFVKFSLTAAATVSIVSTSAAFSPIIQIFKLSGATWTYQSCGSTNYSASLGIGTYAVELKGTNAGGPHSGPYTMTIKDTAAPPPAPANQIACNDDNGTSTTSQIVTNLAAGTYNLVVTGHALTNSGAYTVRLRDLTWFNANSNNETACNDDIVAGVDKSSKIEAALGAGNYWFAVKGYGPTDKGAYALHVLDVSHPAVGASPLTCDDNGGGGTQAQITQAALAAGDYWVVLKGHAATDAGSYKLNIMDLSASGSGSLISCDDDTGDSPQSRIESDLSAGTYQVVVKGKTATDQGAYKLQLRDMTHQPYSILACDDDGRPPTAAYLDQSLAAGTYYIVLKGKTAADKGAYALSLRDVTGRPLVSTACDDNGSTYDTSKLTRTLDPGTYYVALKGKDASHKGLYSLSLGAGTPLSATYAPPDWSTTLGAIQSTGARVIPVLSCASDPTHDGTSTSQNCTNVADQAVSLANASGALGKNLSPVVVDTNGNSNNLSTVLINGVMDMAHNIEMNATVNVVFDPDPNPGFVFAVKPIPRPGNNCKGTVGNTHQKCKWGANMGFQIDVTNPMDMPVPPNPNDPGGGGGYNFHAEVIGDNRFLIDWIPMFVVPVGPPMGPPPPATQYATTGSYWQDLASPGCSGNQAPDWHDLSWVGDAYGNTSITFSACTAQTSTGLTTCTPHKIATVSGAGACATDADCPLGYCDTAISVCQVTTSGTCVSSTQCPANAFCDMPSSTCVFTSQPVYVGATLGADNFQSDMRMKIDLAGTVPFANPPVLHSWGLTYYCNQVL